MTPGTLMRFTTPLGARFAPIHKRFFTVRSQDPMRRMLNQGALYVLAIWCFLLVVVTIWAIINNWWLYVVEDLAVMPFMALCWWLTQRGKTIGIGVITTVLTAAIILDGSLIRSVGGYHMIDVIALMPIVLAALFIVPRAAFAVYGLEIVLVYVLAVLNERTWTETGDMLFAVIVNVGIVTVLLYIGAAIFTRTLQAWLVLNTSLEQRVTDRTADLAAANKYIEARAAARTDEVAKVVHDLRHSLTLVHSAVEATMLDAADAGIDPEALARSEMMANEGVMGLKALLDDMLDAAKLEGNALELRLQPADLSEIVEKAVRQFAPRFQAAECSIDVTIPANLPRVRCDPQRMMRVFYNVLENAITYTSKARADGCAVTVALAREGNMVVCRVADNGPGIAPEALGHLGQRFARVASGENAPEGSGLGLNFSIGILRLSGGSFTLESAGLGLGTTAVLRLPVDASPARTGAAPHITTGAF
jgi:signal transduction histidine kinase